MRAYQRKTLIKKEHWPLIDDWYWCPVPTIEERIEKEETRVKSVKRGNPMWYSFYSWSLDQMELTARLAHACKDGRIRAPSWVEYYKGKGGHIGIYGKCRFCGTSLSDGIKGIIIMEKEL